MTRPADNPFASHRLEAIRFRAPGFSLPALLARLLSGSGRGAIVGPKGSGKTTLLLELAEALNAEGHRVVLLRPNTGEPVAPPVVAPGDALLVDGAGRLGPASWLRLLARARRASLLVVTAHGRTPLRTLFRCVPTPDLAVELALELTGDASFGPHARAAFARHGGNVREALRDLYDLARRGTGVV